MLTLKKKTAGYISDAITKSFGDGLITTDEILNIKGVSASFVV